MSTDPPRAAAAFEVIPAIDVRGGRVVRLVHGDFDRETTYADDPLVVAASFADAGARWIHVVDLDGARDGRARQRAVVAAIVERVAGRVGCQVAGGLRDDEAVAAAIADGAARIVIGTAALANPAFAGRLVGRYGPDRIVAALDLRAGRAIGHGWRAGAPGLPLERAMRSLADEGVARFAVTAIDRDGALLGPDVDLVRRLARLGRGEVIASAGIRSVEDLVAVREAGAAGAIVGRALYEGRLDLSVAITALA